MNFKKLQAMQEELDNAILSEKAEMTAEERFNQTLVSLDVEIAEIANCSEHFKFWKDNKGKVDEKRFYCIPQTQREGVTKPEKWCELSNQSKILTRQQAHKLTLVEECSDALHFILSLANQIGYKIDCNYNESIDFEKIEWNYLELKFQISLMYGTFKKIDDSYKATTQEVVNNFFSYIKKLNVTEEELEQAYYDKNEINYKRLREGY